MNNSFPETAYAPMLREAQEKSRFVSESSTKAAEFATAILYPGSAQDIAWRSEFGSEPDVYAWASYMNGTWLPRYMNLVRLADVEYDTLRLFAEQKNGPQTTPEIQYLHENIDSTGSLTSAAWRAPLSQRGVETRLVAELKIGQLYRQHGRLRLFGDEFCANPVLCHPAQLNMMLDQLGDVQSLMKTQAELSIEDEKQAEFIALQLDTNDLYAAGEPQLRTIAETIAETESLPLDLVGFAIHKRRYDLQITEIADALNMPSEKLDDLIASIFTEFADVSHEVLRAGLMADLYIHAMRGDIEKTLDDKSPQNRLKKLGNRLLGNIRFQRARAVGRSAVKNLGKIPSLPRGF